MNTYQKYDSCYGTITDKCSNGIFILLDNNEMAYAKNFTSHKSGTKVLCTILKNATKKFKTLVSVDSVANNYPYVA